MIIRKEGHRLTTAAMTGIKRLDDHLFVIELSGVGDDGKAAAFTILASNEEMVALWKAAESL